MKDQLVDDWIPARDRTPRAQFVLDGFVYEGIVGQHDQPVRDRLAWLRAQYRKMPGEWAADFTTQPYEQLAAVYRRAGQDASAREVAIAKRRDLRRYGSLSPWRRAGNWALDAAIGYGYKTWRAAVALVAVYGLAVWLAWLAQRTGVIVPVDTSSDCTRLRSLLTAPPATRASTPRASPPTR